MIRPLLAPALLSALLLLVACNGDPAPPAAGFSIVIEPAAITMRALEAATIEVGIARGAGFSGPVTVTLTGNLAGLKSEPVTVAGDAASLAVTALAAAEPGPRVLMVQASAGETVRYEPLTVTILEAAAVATLVTVNDESGATDGSVRQGSGPVTLSISGTNLLLADGFSLGELPLAELPGRTDSQLQLEVEVGHGAQLASHDLVLTSAGVETVWPEALVVTPISVAESGSDTDGRGTPASPFRSLKRALVAAGLGDTVVLAPGTYSAATGESWPLLTGAPNVPAGVTIMGEAATLLGPGAGSLVAGLSFAAGATSIVHDLTVSGFGAGFLVSDAGASAQLLRTSALANSSGALVEDASLAATDSTFNEGGSGIRLLGSSEAVLDGVRIDGNSLSGIRALGGSVGLTVSGGLLAGNTQAGLWFDGATLELRDTEVRDNGEFGIYVEGEPTAVDLGTHDEPGGNDIHGNGPGGTGDQLLDVRPARASLGVPVIFTISGTILAGELPPAGVYVGVYMGYPQFSILGANNTIQVY